MEKDIIEKVDELSEETKQAAKRIDESFERMIVMCDELLEQIKRFSDKVDKY